VTVDTYILTSKPIYPDPKSKRYRAWCHVIEHKATLGGLTTAKAAIDAMPIEQRGSITGADMFSWAIRKGYVQLIETTPAGGVS
jgi:hypothetical protein